MSKCKLNVSLINQKHNINQKKIVSKLIKFFKLKIPHYEINKTYV